MYVAGYVLPNRFSNIDYANVYLYANLICIPQECKYTRVIFYVRREVDLMKTAKAKAYIMHIFGKIELLSIHAT